MEINYHLKIQNKTEYLAKKLVQVIVLIPFHEMYRSGNVGLANVPLRDVKGRE